MVWGIKLLSLDDVVNKQNKLLQLSLWFKVRMECFFRLTVSWCGLTGAKGSLVWCEAAHVLPSTKVSLTHIAGNWKKSAVYMDLLFFSAVWCTILKNNILLLLFPPLSVIYLNNYVIIWFVKAQINILWALVTTKTHYVFVTISTVNRIRKAKV